MTQSPSYQHLPFPQVNISDHLRQAASDIITILTSPPSTTVPSLKAGNPTRNALLELATQLKRIEPLPIDSTSTTASPTVISSTQPSPKVTTLKKTQQNATPPRVEEEPPRVEEKSIRVENDIDIRKKVDKIPTKNLLRRSRLPKKLQIQ